MAGKEKLRIVGKSVPDIHSVDKVTGRAEYSIDVVRPGMLYGKVLSSPYAHVEIESIDVSKAKALPGVVEVFTYKDVPPEVAEPVLLGKGIVFKLVDKEIPVTGFPVAAVVARDPDIAEEALDLIEVKYKVLPHTLYPEEVKPEYPVTRVRGDVERGFREADIIVEHETRTNRQQICALQPGACVVEWHGSKLTIWDRNQQSTFQSKYYAKFLGMRSKDVRVLCKYAGGGFGEANTLPEVTIFSLMSKKIGRPIKHVRTREEEDTWRGARPRTINIVRVGVKRDGTITAIYHKMIENAGKNYSIIWGDIASTAYYRCPNVKYEGLHARTNVYTRYFRGVENTAATFAVETTMDMVAEKLGMDPVEFRLKNCARAGDKYFFPCAGQIIPQREFTYSRSGFEECIKKAAEVFGWKEKWKGWGKPYKVEGSKRRGVGMCIFGHGGGGGFGLPFSSATVSILEDGSVKLIIDLGDMGQMLHTTTVQACAEALGARLEDITLITGDSDLGVAGPLSVASQASFGASLAVKKASEEAKKQLLTKAAEMLGVKPEELEAADSKIYVKTNPEKKVSFQEVLEAIGHQVVVSTVVFCPCVLGMGACFAEVEVDTETGEVKVIRIVEAYDVGKALNPTVVEAQMEGGTMQGIGYALKEDHLFDKATGRILNANMLDYKVPTICDMPEEITPVIVETPLPEGAYGNCGVGESQLVPQAAAIANAIYNAIGVRINELPITPDKILKALGKI